MTANDWVLTSLVTSPLSLQVGFKNPTDYSPAAPPTVIAQYQERTLGILNPLQHTVFFPFFAIFEMILKIYYKIQSKLSYN